MKGAQIAGKEGEPTGPQPSNLSRLLLMFIAVLAVVGVALLVVLVADDDDDDTESSSSSEANVFPLDLSLQDLSCGLGDLSGRFATKTVYQNRIPLDSVTDEVTGASLPSFFDAEECSLEKVYFIARHGTRLPTDGTSEEMQEFGFNMDMDFQNEGLLLPVGKEELYSIGKRFKARYESILGQTITYHPRVYEFNSSAKVRALESAESFAQGFFENEEELRPIVAIKSLDEDNDPYLRFHSACALHEFQEDREDEDSSFARIQELNAKYLPILEEHFESLDIDGDILEYATVLYNACPFEQAQGCVNSNGNEDYTDSACELIDNSTIIEVMEYLADAEDYYYAGLGDQVNMDQSCIMRNEIVDFLNGLSVEVEDMDFRFGFGHSETLLPLIAHFNFSFYQDGDEVLEDNLFTIDSDLFTDEVLNRNYRSSIISPLANNIAFERYTCDGDDQLAILHNEIVVFEGTLESFLEISNFYEDECDFDVLCAAPDEEEVIDTR